MMKPMPAIHSKRGISLLEATVAVVVLTVVSFTIFKKMVSLVEFSRCREAFENFTAIHRAMEECYYTSGSYTSCGNLSSLNLPNPNKSPTTHFIYEIFVYKTNEFEIMATRTPLDGGTTTDTITFKRDHTGIVKRSGTGAFAGIQ